MDYMSILRLERHYYSKTNTNKNNGNNNHNHNHNYNNNNNNNNKIIMIIYVILLDAKDIFGKANFGEFETPLVRADVGSSLRVPDAC